MSRDVTPTAIAVRVVALCLMVLCARRSDAELAFSANRGQAQEIYSIDERVGEPSVRNLTNHFANDYMPDWSPDGRQIAFTSDRDDSPGDIFVMDSDGASQRNLTRHPARDLDPSWAPDGKHIAFASWRNVRPDIFVVDIDGGGLRALTEHPHIDWEPSWSPDGRWIAFTSWKAGADIHLISPDGDVITRLTDHPEEDSQASWSSDGRYIAFTSRRDGLPKIYVMESDGTRLRRLANEPGWDLDPTWSPDGSTVAFASLRGVGSSHLMTVDIDTRETTRVTMWADKWGPGEDRHPAWLPTSLGVDVSVDHRALMWGWLKQLGAARRK